MLLQGVLINPGWEVPGASGGGAAVANLCRLPLPGLCPVGFVFIWVQKPDILAVVVQMRQWGFCYVENLTWVFLHRNNRIMRLPSPHFRRSHLTLFLFRKDGRVPASSPPPTTTHTHTTTTTISFPLVLGINEGQDV